MVSPNNHTIANGIISAFVFMCGIAMSILLSRLVKMAMETIEINIDPANSSFNESMVSNSKLWMIGLVYSVPGLIGVIASLVKQKCAYITQMIFNIITLVIMGLACIAGLMALGNLSTSPSCVSIGNTCSCSGGQIILNHSCDDMNEMYTMAIATILVIIAAWVLTMVATIICGILMCRNNQFAGIIMQVPGQQPAVVQIQTSSSQSYMAPPSENVLTTYDRAQLIQNGQ